MRDASEVPFISEDGVFAVYERERLRAMADASNAEDERARYAAAVVVNGLWPPQVRHGASVLDAVSQNPALRRDPRYPEFFSWMQEWIRVNGEDQSRAWVEYQNALLARIGEEEAQRVLDAWAKPRAEAINAQLEEAERHRPTFTGGQAASPPTAPVPPPPAAPGAATAQASPPAHGGSTSPWRVLAWVGGGLLGAFVLLAVLGAVLDLTSVEEQAGDEGAAEQGAAIDPSDGDSGGNGGGRTDDYGRPTTRVTDVIDGDTVETDSLGDVRLIGVDTPEEGRCYDNAATDFTQQRIGGAVVGYELGVEEEDRYGRTLAYLFRGNEMHNLALVEEGYAKVLTIPPNDKYAGSFEGAERSARRQGEGLWDACTTRLPKPPGGGTDADGDGDRNEGGGGGGGYGGGYGGGGDDDGDLGDGDIPLLPGE